MHLIFVTKYRKQLLSKYGDEIKQIFINVAKEQDFQIIEMEIDKDHIRLLIHYCPVQSILDIVRLLKQISTYRIWRQNNNDAYLAKQFWNNRTFWSDGYFACSVGNVSKDIIVKYIENQG